MRRSSAAVLLMPGLLFAWPALGAPPSLTQARQSYEALHFTDVQFSAQTAVSAGALEPEQLAQWYFLWGEASAAMDAGPQAEALFGRALEISRVSLLGADVPPKIARRFARAEAKLGHQRLALSVGPAYVQAGVARLRVSLSGDAFGLAARLRVFPRGLPAQTGSPPLADFGWACSTDPCAYVVEASDEHGNVLARAGSAERPLLLDALPMNRATSTAFPPSPPRPFLRRPLPYLLGGGALALLAGGMLLGFLEKNAALEDITIHRSEHDYSEIAAANHARVGFRAAAIGSGAVSLGFFTTAAFVW